MSEREASVESRESNRRNSLLSAGHRRLPGELVKIIELVVRCRRQLCRGELEAAAVHRSPLTADRAPVSARQTSPG